MLTFQRARRVLWYRPDTGDLTWRVRKQGIRIGQRAGTLQKNGQFRIGIDGKKYLASRVIWLWMTGNWPAAEIDHRDVNPANNRWSNLREATAFQNRGNTRVYRNNKAGVKGVYWNKEKNKWHSRIHCDRKKSHLGYFDSIEDAQGAYRRAAMEQFGDFARSE